MIEPLHIQLFGGLRVRQGERVISRFRTQKTGGLLAYLAYHRGHSHGREVLIETFWPEASPESGRHNLSHALSSLRSLLEPPGVAAGSVIIADRFSVELNPDLFTTDVAEFESAVRVAAQSRNRPEQSDLLLQAMEKYRGALLPDYYEDWIAPAQERLGQRFRQAATQAVALLEKAGRIEQAIDAAERVISLDADPEEEFAEHAARLLAAIQERPTGPQPPISARTAPSGGPAASSLPSGTVTVLMTDIEGSTALWEKTGAAFRSALSIHHALLRNEFRRHGGHEAKEAGDSFLVVFPAVSDALACAIACQKSLASQPWPEEVGDLKVRMALHTGDIELDESDSQDPPEYHGLMLHRASRMLSAAHGGQILTSEATAGLLKRDLEPEVQLYDLGIWRLRDIEEPERLFQVDYPNRDVSDFPPLNATPARSAKLPMQFTRFFGRETEVARIVELLSDPDVRLLSLTGPGGTGKTRLGIEGVGRFADSQDGAVWFVPLADLSDPDLIPTAILQAMGVPLSGSKEPLEQAAAALSKKPTLLLLDNFEQLVAGGAELVQSLFYRCESLRCVVTSRQTLGLPAEVEFAVPPLSTPNGSDTPERLSLFESVRLFVDRAQAAKPDFRITNANAPALAELCDRLEGIPLAIELAAARALVLSPAQMLAQLGNRFEFLVSRKRGVAERQKTLRAAVDWSYRLLDPELQRFLAKLSVFRGGWTVEAAEAVCDEPMALDMLAQLRECSLVTTHDSEFGIRFRMLETLREYAEEQLTSVEQLATTKRHAEYFALALENTTTRSPSKYHPLLLDLFAAEQENVRQALSWATAPGGSAETGARLAVGASSFWEVRGYYAEGRGWLDRLLAVGEQIPMVTRGLILAESGVLAWRHGDQGTAREKFEAALKIGREQGSQYLVQFSLIGLGNQACIRGEHARAHAFFEEGLAIRRELGDRVGVANALVNLGAVAGWLGDYGTSRTLFVESLAELQALGDLRSATMPLAMLGIIGLRTGDIVSARERLEESLTICRDLGDRRGIFVALSNLGEAAYLEGDYGTARTLLIEGLSHAVDTGALSNNEGAVSVLGYVEAALGEPLRAARLCGADERSREQMGTPFDPSEQALHDQRVAAVRAALADDDAFDRAWHEGRAMTLEQALAYALEEEQV